jgi:uncharacterized RDD family membrane protein YckC
MLLLAMLAELVSLDFADVSETQIRLQRVAVLLFWIPVEAILVALFAATPGKWLFALTVRRQDGSRLSFGQAVRRSLLVFVYGLGAGFLAPLTQLWAFWRLANDGDTTWDRECSSVVAWHRNYLRVGVGAVVLVLCFHRMVALWSTES